MTLKITASFVEAGISYFVEGASVAEVAAAVTQLKVGEKVVGDTAMAETTKATKAPKPAKETSAASPPPAAETPKADTAASAKKEEPSASTPATYEKTGFAEKIAGYLGQKDESAEYAARRAKLVALLGSFNVKKGPDLKAEQFADFGVKLDALIAPPAADEDLG